MNKIILLGPPATGKGTQAKMLAKEFNIPHISTGDILRTISQEKTKIGKKIADFLKIGDLVSDELVLSLLQKRLNEDDCKLGFILDGVPRDIEQAKKISKFIDIDYVILIETGDELIIKRVINRSSCPKCGKIYGIDIPPKEKGICDLDGAALIRREDDNEDAIRHRLEVYRKKTEPLITFYGKKVKKVNGEKPIPKLFENIKSLIV